MRPAAIGLLAAVLAAFAAWSGEADAHPVGISRGDYQWANGELLVGTIFARRELSAALPWLAREGVESPAAFAEHREALGAWLVEKLRVAADGAPCRASFDGMRFDGDGVAMATRFSCPSGAARLAVEAGFAQALARGHRHLASVGRGGRAPALDPRGAGERVSETDGEPDEDATEVVTAASPSFTIDLAPGPEQAPRRALFVPLLRLGLEHIFTGYDHLVFLLGLALVGGPLRSLLAAITAFTAAHSITLALAALGVWAPSPRLVEPCIALSIAYVGVENWSARSAAGRWRITFPFGLVHGFGFAGALQALALPRAEAPRALFAFNLGVELGQLAVLAAAIPIILAARRTATWDRIGMRACAAAIAVAGVVWFVARVRGSA